MSQFYSSGLQAMLEAYFQGNAPAPNLTDILVAPVDNVYVWNDSHSSTDDVGDHFVGDPSTLTNVTLTHGVIDADDIILTGFATNTLIQALIVFAAWDGGSQLLAYIDSSTAPTLPLLSKTTTAAVSWDAAGIFRI